MKKQTEGPNQNVDLNHVLYAKYGGKEKLDWKGQLEVQTEFVKIFLRTRNPFKMIARIFNVAEGQKLTREEIANILIQNKFASNINEALTLTDQVVQKEFGSIKPDIDKCKFEQLPQDGKLLYRMREFVSLASIG